MSILFLFLGTKMSVIGLTGGIACGKSTVVELLAKLGQNEFKVIDSDKIVHEMYKDDKFVAKVFSTFGKENVAAEDGKSVDRAKLGAIVFADREKRRQLAKLTDMPIFIEILKAIFRLRVLQGNPLVVLDAPLLFESKVLEYFCYPILVVAISDKDK